MFCPKYRHVPIYASFKYVEPLLTGKKVLDAGCSSRHYLKSFFDTTSVGVDINIEHLRRCIENGCTVACMDLNSGLGVANESFDAVLLGHVLELVDSPIELLREANRILRPNGLLVVGVPFEQSLIRLVDHYFRKHSGHLYAFSLDNMAVLLERTGYRIERTVIDLVLVRRLKLRWLLHLAQMVPPNWVKWFSNAYWVVSRKTRQPLGRGIES